MPFYDRLLKYFNRPVELSTDIEEEEIEQKNPSLISDKIQEEYYQRIKKTLRDWYNAQHSAASKSYTDKEPLMRIYDQIMDDTDIYGAITKRYERILQTNFIVYNNGEITDEYDELFKDNWFFDTIKGFMESFFFGFSLMEIEGRTENNIPSGIINIPRYNVLPEKLMYKGKNNNKSFKGNNWVLFNYFDKFGLLNKLIPLWIYKKEAMKAWAIYSEKFGTPIRIGKTPSNDPIDRQKFLDYLRDIGNSSTAVINVEDTIEFLSTTQTDAYNVYKELIKLLNEEIEKLILGGTMLMSDGSSYSQSKVHQDEYKIKVGADLRNLEFWINKYVIKKLKNLEFIKVNDYIKIKFDNTDKVTLEQRIDMDKHLIQQGYEIDIEYLNETYNTKVIGKNDMDTTSSTTE